MCIRDRHVSDPDEYVGTLVQRHLSNPQSFFGTDQDFFSKSSTQLGGKISDSGRPYDRPCRARPRNTFPNPALHGKSRAANPPFLPAGTQGRKRRFLRQQRARFFQSRILDRGGKLLTVGGHMIALVERGREMPFPIRLFTENLAQRNLLSFPPGHRKKKGDFSGNNARDFSKVGFWTEWANFLPRAAI